MTENRMFEFEVTFSVQKILSESDVKSILGYDYDKITDADWTEAAYEYINEKLKDVGNLLNKTFDVLQAKVTEI